VTNLNCPSSSHASVTGRRDKALAILNLDTSW